MWSVIRNAFRREALLAAFASAVLAVGLGAISPESAQAATLYVSEFATGVTNSPGSDQAQIPPQASIADQNVALSGTTAASSAFNAKTHAVMLMCDEGCSIAFGGSTITAATTNFLLQQGVPYTFGVAPGQFIAAIANSAGNTGGGAITGTVTANQGTAGSTPWLVGTAPSSSATFGVTPVVTAAAASSKVLKSGAGNLYGFSCTSGASAGACYVFDATALPGNGAVTPIDCVIVAATQTAEVTYNPPLVVSSGATVGFGTGTNCFSLTASATAFISGEAK